MPAELLRISERQNGKKRLYRSIFIALSRRSFGIYAAIIIAVNYVLVMTFFPVSVVLYHNTFERSGGSSGCCSCDGPTTTELAARRGAAGAEAQRPCLQALQRTPC